MRNYGPLGGFLQHTIDVRFGSIVIRAQPDHDGIAGIFVDVRIEDYEEKVGQRAVPADMHFMVRIVRFERVTAHASSFI
jgi:hypothetical protein